MSLIQELRSEIRRLLHTLSRRQDNTVDASEKKALVRVIDSLEGRLSQLKRSALLDAANTLSDVVDDLERAVAALRVGPFDGYLAALDEHLRNLNVLSGEMHARERLLMAPEENIPHAPAARTRAPRAGARGIEPPRPVKNYDQIKDEYQAYYDACTLRPEHQDNVNYYVKRLKQGRAVYEQVGRDLGGIPWAFIGVIHGMECGFNFSGHLHNGDSLTARTVHVPAGRPATSSPPFTWRNSAADALTMKGFHHVTDWSIPHMLYLLEKYNGFGYRLRRVPTPYLWSFSNLYERGKFVTDGRFDPRAVSKQCGAALMLKAALGS